MASCHDAHRAVFGKRRPRVAVSGSHLRQRSRHVQFRNRRCRRPNPLGMFGREHPHFREQLPFERENLFLGIQDFALVVFQLRRRESLGIHQRLFALVIRRRQVLVGFGDFDVIAEYVIEANLQRLDAGARPLARFDLRDVLAAVLAQVAQFVEFGVVAGANRAAVGNVHRRRIGDGGQNAIANFRQLVELLVDGAQSRGPPRPR